jgi:hypothetical protein
VKAKAKPKAKAKAKVKVKRQAVERPTRRGVRPVRSVPAPSNPPPPPAEPELVIEAEVATPQAAPDRPSPFDQRARRANAAPLPWILLDEGFSAQGGIETIDAAAMARLRAHVLRLKGGRFGGGDAFVSLPADADALVHEHLHDWIAHGTHQGDGVARVVLVAHDIMESEATTLRLARHHAGWWLANGVYPIHIIWESGLRLRRGHLARAMRPKAASIRFSRDRSGLSARRSSGRARSAAPNGPSTVTRAGRRREVDASFCAA